MTAGLPRLVIFLLSGRTDDNPVSVEEYVVGWVACALAVDQPVQCAGGVAALVALFRSAVTNFDVRREPLRSIICVYRAARAR